LVNFTLDPPIFTLQKTRLNISRFTLNFQICQPIKFIPISCFYAHIPPGPTFWPNFNIDRFYQVCYNHLKTQKGVIILDSVTCQIFPTKSQEKTFNSWLKECYTLYNTLVDHRQNSWTQQKTYVTLGQQTKLITAMRKENPKLKNIYSQVLYNVAHRVDKRYHRFFVEIKTKIPTTSPKHMIEAEYNSFTYPQHGFKIILKGLYLSKIGTIRLQLPETFNPADIRSCTIIRKENQWYAMFHPPNPSKKVRAPK